ncbi:hypothetical protein DSM112329_01884 [Paraconexibacter sp. AEG42_29]|uniref:Anti-sigma factor antagonist n=1 Tax=Paraconexibacter sp. AEG42_29 TaxID=2997339 RepID=A0AAU7ATW2_9ACTN
MSVPQPAPFRTTLDAVDPSTQVLACFGELDMATAPGFQAALEEVTAPALVVDLTGLQFLDSTGIGAILSAKRQRPDRLSVVVAGGPVRRILEVTSLDDVLAVRATLGDAVAATAAAP